MNLELHRAFLVQLEIADNPDYTAIENEQMIIDGMSGAFPESWSLNMQDIGSLLNHQAWHCVTHNKYYAYAEVLVNKALECSLFECDFLDTLAELRFRQGSYKEAIRIIDVALEQKTDRGKPMGKSKKHYLYKQRDRFMVGSK